MTNEQFKLIVSILLNGWTRYGASWVLKLLTAYCGYDFATAQEQSTKVVAGVAILVTVLIDFIHHRYYDRT